MSKFSTSTVLVIATSVFLAACDGQGGQSGLGAESAGPLALHSKATFGQVTLDWTPAEPATVLYSSDPDCHWDTYTVCADSGMLLNQNPGVSLGKADGLELDQNYAFVVETDRGRSEPKIAAPWVPRIPSGAESTLVHDGIWYVGGHFDRVVPVTGNAAIFDSESGAMEGALQQVNGLVRAVVAAEDGGWYIGGNFSEIGSESHQSLARIRADGSLDRNWRPSLEQSWPPGHDGRVRTLAVDSGVLYVGGVFNTVDGIPRDGLAAFDQNTGELTDWAPAVSLNGDAGIVSNLAVVGNKVAFSGGFDSVEGQARQRVAVVRKDGELVSVSPQLQRGNDYGSVNALAVVGNRLYIGGRFDQAGGAPASHLAAYDMETGDRLDWTPEANSEVLDLVVADDSLYLTGYFSEITQDGTAHRRARIAAFDLNTGEVDAWSSDAWESGMYNTLSVDGDRIYVGGRFTLERADRVHRNLIALDRGTGDALPWEANTGDRVDALSMSNGWLYVGGNFDTAGGVNRRYLAAFDAQDGTLLDWAPRFSALASNPQVYALQSDAERLYVGGIFNSVNGETRRALAAFALPTGELVDWHPEVRTHLGSVDGRVRSMQLVDDTLYMNGQFIHVDGEDRQGLAAVSTTGAGNHWVTNWEPQLERDSSSPSARVMGVHQGDLVIGGQFDHVDGEPQHNLALLDTQTGALARDWNPVPESSVVTVLSMGDNLFLGSSVSGGYESYPELDLSTMLARFTGPLLDLETDWNLFYDEQDHGGVSALAGADDRVIVAVSPRDTLGRLSSFLLHEPDEEAWHVTTNRPISDLAYHEGYVYIVGRFDSIEGQNRPGMAVLDAQTGELVH